MVSDHSPCTAELKRFDIGDFGVAWGGIALGSDADFCVFAPDDAFVVNPEHLYHKNQVTPYAGRPLAGVVRGTWLRGTRIDDEPRGQLIARGEA